MNRTIICVLFSILVFLSSNAYSWATGVNFPSPHLASIEIRTNLHGGRWAYLVQRPHWVNSRKGTMDSTLVNDDGTIIFRFFPDPNSWYRIDVEDAPVAYGCFAMGDSIIVQKHRDSMKVIYDRIGAYTEENRHYLYYGQKTEVLDFFGDTSCAEIPSFFRFHTCTIKDAS